LPGGGVEHGEDPRAAVVREVAEETGLELVAGRLLDVHAVHFTGRAPDGELEDFHGVHLIFHGTVIGTRTAQVTEAGGTTDAVDWVPIAAVRAGSVPALDVVRAALDAAGVG
jgi:ADP-ribose pyrophosphatase YjhB (NUDIX family)